MAVGYGPDLVHDLLGTVFPVHFRVPVDDASVRRVLEISGTYSKNRRGGDGRRRGEGGGDEGKFEPYGDEKERRASDEMRDAAKSILWPSFDRLEKSRYNIRASAGAKKINGEDEDEDESAPKNKAVRLSGASAGAKKINGEDEDEDESAPKNKAMRLSENALNHLSQVASKHPLLLCIDFIVSGIQERLEQKDVHLEEATAPMRVKDFNQEGGRIQTDEGCDVFLEHDAT
jgi:hypothetical protein